MLRGLPVCLACSIVGGVLLALDFEPGAWIFLCLSSLPTAFVMAWHVHAIAAILGALAASGLCGSFVVSLLRGGGGFGFLAFALLPLFLGAVIGAFAGLFTRR
jgi:hypothetical protein